MPLVCGRIIVIVSAIIALAQRKEKKRKKEIYNWRFSDLLIWYFSGALQRMTGMAHLYLRLVWLVTKPKTLTVGDETEDGSRMRAHAPGCTLTCDPRT